jgi:hypothetical protein
MPQTHDDYLRLAEKRLPVPFALVVALLLIDALSGVFGAPNLLIRVAIVAFVVFIAVKYVWIDLKKAKAHFAQPANRSLAGAKLFDTKQVMLPLWAIVAMGLIGAPFVLWLGSQVLWLSVAIGAVLVFAVIAIIVVGYAKKKGVL